MLALITISVPAFSQYSDADSLMAHYRPHIQQASARREVDPLIVESDMIATPFTKFYRYGDLAVEHYYFLTE